MTPHSTAVATTISVVGTVITVPAIVMVPVLTYVNAARTDIKLHGLCCSYRARTQRYQRGESQDISLHNHSSSQNLPEVNGHGRELVPLIAAVMHRTIYKFLGAKYI